MRYVADSFVEFMKALARALRARRLGLGLTQERLAHEAGISVRHYQLLESEEPSLGANPRCRTLYNIARVLKTDVAELVDPSRRSPATRRRAPRRR